MSDGHDPILEAVEALKLRGHKVEPWGDEFDAWLVVSRPALGSGRKIKAWFIADAGRRHLIQIDASKRAARSMRSTRP